MQTLRYRTFKASLSCWFAADAEWLTRSVKGGSRYILKEIRETAQDEKQGWNLAAKYHYDVEIMVSSISICGMSPKSFTAA